MTLLEKVLNILKRRSKKSSSKKSTIIRYCKFQKIEDSDINIQKLYIEYKTFDICQCDATYHITVHFSKNVKQNEKFEIYNFVREYFEQSMEPLMIFLHIGMEYNMSVAHKSIPEQKRIILFLGKFKL